MTLLLMEISISLGVRVEGVWSSKGLFLLNIVTGQKEKQKMTSVSLF
jgi:hypothetical protein